MARCEVQTIQIAGKGWKFIILAGVGLISYGMVEGMSTSGDAATGFLVESGGFLTFLVGKVGAWWFPG